MHKKKLRDEALFLAEINANLPRGIDWGGGAKCYLTRLIQAEGEQNRRYHLVKPFVGGPDFSPFYSDMYHFLNLMEKLALPPRSRILDVGCGPGWVSHYLGKLGYSVLGVDISTELVNLARERVIKDPFPPYLDRPFDVSFHVHDIEKDPLTEHGVFDAAVFESTMHHFLNPIAVVRHVAASLTPGGVLGIIEAAARPGSSWMEELRQTMLRYHTLERPLTRRQMRRLLAITGFDHYRFYNPINGFFPESQASAHTAKDMAAARELWNVCIACRESKPALENEDILSIGNTGTLTYESGFFPEEHDPHGHCFRWSGMDSRISLEGVQTARFKLASYVPRYEKKTQHIRVFFDGGMDRILSLRSHDDAATLTVQPPNGRVSIRFMADTVFCPAWHGIPDDRQLAFQLHVEALRAS